MIDDEIEFERPTDELEEVEPPPPPGRGPGIFIAGACALVVAISLVGYFVFRLRPAPPAAPQTAEAPVSTSSAAPAPEGAVPPTPDPSLPALADSDGFVRKLASALATDPLVASWLAGEGLIRRFVVVVVNIAQGENPATHLGFLAPPQPFHALYVGGHFVIDPDSYRRFDTFTAAVSSVNAAEAAKIYRTLRPLSDAAARELGQAPGAFDGLVAQAIAALVATPVADGDVVLKFTPPFYRFADLKLETLAPAQKQLLRMGPRNARAIQAKLREISDALAVRPAP